MTRRDVEVLLAYLDRQWHRARAEGDAQAARDAVALRLPAEAGLGPSEIIGLRVGDVELNDDQSQLVVRHGRYGRSRQVAISPALSDLMVAYLDLRTQREGALDVDAPLFQSRKGDGWMCRSALHLRWRRALEAAGLPKRSMPAARRAYGRELLQETGDVSLVARRLGLTQLASLLSYLPEPFTPEAAR
jgi:integrase